MRKSCRWIARGWRTEAPVLLLAAGLALATLAWEDALHSFANQPGPRLHLLRDALLLLPLALVAARWGTSSGWQRRFGLARAAARTAGAFAALLTPATAVHTILDAADHRRWPTPRAGAGSPGSARRATITA